MFKSSLVQQGNELSLFPFLDVLSGVIGILALIISVLAILGLQDEDLLAKQWRSSNGKAPVFVECRAEGLVIHPNRNIVALDQPSDRSSLWQKKLRSTERRKDREYFVFLIRPDGIQTYQDARHSMAQSQIIVGKEVLDAGPILQFN